MRTLESQQTLMRIFLSEADKHDGKPLYQTIMKRLQDAHAAGATVLRGISGFGTKSHKHSAHLLSLSQDLPIIIEVVDTQENIERLTGTIDDIMTEGLIALEKVNVIRYSPGQKKSQP